jgi:GTPase
MGFSKDDSPFYPSRFNIKKNQYWAEVIKKSAKIVNFLDLCGHEKYLKTTIYGMMSYSPDYGMIIVGSNSGLVGMSREHIMLT